MLLKLFCVNVVVDPFLENRLIEDGLNACFLPILNKHLYYAT